MEKPTLERLNEKILRFPRVPLVPWTTPLQSLSSLSRELNGPKILVKRDDLTGLAFGGNKTRKLEFIIADALEKKADTIITWASLQSNWCLQLAAAARKHGLKPILVLFRTYDLPFSYQGNLLLDFLLEADIRIEETEEKGKSVDQKKAFSRLEKIAEDEKKNGRKPYVVSVGGSTTGGDMEKPLGALAYLRAIVEIESQLLALNQKVDHLIIASGSGATQAGLLVGAKALGLETRVIGICVSDKKEEFSSQVKNIALELKEMLELNIDLEDRDIILFDEYLDEGYGVVNAKVARIIRQVFEKEGLVLDPVYTSKAVIGLVDLIKKGYFTPEEQVLFIHTGGTPALFAYNSRLVELLQK
ncbi:MAG: D-cysteine desulfhydrase family protein [Candidatus Saccharicenans sp.]|nr:MAG: hypothetical protein C0168_04100 [Candidatus Aminicenantes bacterium]HEK85643.1 D-cysteine desulfhydrase family protein [Candidatus Aminicenantes bacterium]